MNFTKDQERALAMIDGLREWSGHPKIGVLAGYAGTGKSTLIGEVPNVLDGCPVIVCPTGKAALRVREATGLKAQTIHSWMYSPKEDFNTGEVTYTRKEIELIDPGEIGLLVIDEASMVGQDLWDDIYDTCLLMKMNVLIVGDPGQLPPVTKEDDDETFFSLLSAEFRSDQKVMMTEVVRQAQDNPIIRASMLVRDGQLFDAINQLPRISPKEILTYAKELRDNGAIICHRNNTRLRLNLMAREAFGLPPDRIVPGEPLLVLQNMPRLYRFNGEIVKFENWIEEPRGQHVVNDWFKKQKPSTAFGWAQLEHVQGDPYAQCLLGVEQVFGRFSHVSLKPLAKAARVVMGVNREIPDNADELPEKEVNEIVGPPYLHCNFGYVLTCHKAQGSEFDRCLVLLEPSIRFNTDFGKRWLYTSLTRARTTTTVCLGVPKALTTL